MPLIFCHYYFASFIFFHYYFISLIIAFRFQLPSSTCSRGFRRHFAADISAASFSWPSPAGHFAFGFSAPLPLLISTPLFSPSS
jgi:hypothetical protein